MSSFASRVLVALILLPVVLGLVYVGGWWLTGFALVGGLLALHELYAMARGHRPVVLAGYAGFVLFVVGWELGGLGWALGGLLATVALAFMLFLLSPSRPSATGALGVTTLGVTWIGGGIVGLLSLRAIEPEDIGRVTLYTVLLAVFADDTVAYLVGRAIGRHKMAPTISPGKSWEGFVAGTMGAIAVAFFALYSDRDEFLSIPEAIVLGAVIAVAGALGDLFESAIKRDLGVKDSGRLLGGHGGVLDRIDSLLFAGPAAYFLILAFGHG